MNNNFNFNQEDLTGMFDSTDIEQNKAVTIIGYIPILFIIPLLAAQNSRYAKFHANQGCILTILSAACSVISSLLGLVIGWIPFIGGVLVSLISVVLGISVFLLIIIGIVNAASGKAKKLPIIGDIIEIIK